jgi:hypothetical protein
LGVVYRQAGKVLAVREMLYRPLQGLRLISLQVALHISAQAISQDFGSPL